MIEEQKISEFRPAECGTRFGDIVRVGDNVVIRVKCRRCTKRDGVDKFHDLVISSRD